MEEINLNQKNKSGEMKNGKRTRPGLKHFPIISQAGERRVGSTPQLFVKISHETYTPLPVYAERSDFVKVNDNDKNVIKERKRLEAIYKDIPSEKLKVVEGLIIQAARLRVMLDYMWKDIQENGEYNMFQQSQNLPSYERERPVARLYNTRDQSYQRVIKQLTDLLPKENKQVETDEPVDDYV